MAKHMVKCPYCNQIFDANAVEHVVIGRRYAHKECAEERQIKVKSKEEKESLEDLREKQYTELISYIKSILKDDYIDAKVKKQITDFKEEYGYTYSGMLGTLVWWHEVCGKGLEGGYGGIGILPYIYGEARNYFDKIQSIRLANWNKDLRKIINKETLEITIPSPKKEVVQNISLFQLD